MLTARGLVPGYGGIGQELLELHLSRERIRCPVDGCSGEMVVERPAAGEDPRERCLRFVCREDPGHAVDVAAPALAGPELERVLHEYRTEGATECPRCRTGMVPEVRLRTGPLPTVGQGRSLQLTLCCPWCSSWAVVW